MTLDIHLSPEAARLLRERAAAKGLDVAEYASKIVEEDLLKPTLDEILAPVRADFAKSGMSEEQIIELGRSQLEALRDEKRGRSGG